MRWNSVKKTAQWAVFRNSPEGFSLRVRGAHSAARNPLQATTIVTGQAIAWPVLFSGQVARIRTDEVEFRQEYHPLRFTNLVY